MNGRRIITVASAALLAARAVSGLAAQEREVPEPPERPEPVELHQSEPREIELRDTRVEATHEAAGTDMGWQADAIRGEGAERDERGDPVRAGEVIAFALPPDAERLLVVAGFRVIRRTPLASLGGDVIRLGIPRGRSLAAALRDVRAAAPDAVTDFDHYYGLGLASRARPRPEKPGLSGAALAGATPGRFAVGMIDTAVAPHSALATARLITWSTVGAPANADAQHGTAVASLIAARGQATIYSANIFRGPPARPYTSIDILAEAMEWMLGQGAPVINMSIAGPPNALLEKLVAIAGARGRIIVAAAGNGGPAAPPVFPAALPGVIAVTAVDPDLRIYRYANHGHYIDVAAQGVGVRAARAAGGYARFTGTSFAAPAVAAVLAQCRESGASAPVCIGRLYQSARDLGPPGDDDAYGHGYID